MYSAVYGAWELDVENPGLELCLGMKLVGWFWAVGDFQPDLSHRAVWS